MTDDLRLPGIIHLPISGASMTRLPGVPDRGDVIRGMAYFVGTGPEGTSCSQCAYFWDGSERSAGGCREFMRLRAKKDRKVLRIPPRPPSCRYFNQRRPS
jgi:hypothetical protein